jgi:serine/threonine-protein kinase
MPTMPLATVAELIHCIRTFRLLSPTQIEKLGQLQGRLKDVQVVARKLVAGNWLTAYQVNQLLIHGSKAELLLGPYVILEKLGEGGMGHVYKARNWKMNRLVALKVIRKERLGKPGAIQRFYREARAAAQLSHPNVVHAFDADQVRDTHMLVMEYIDGPDLAKLVKEKGPLPVPLACEYIVQAARGLQHAHERGLVHRDIKPSNLLVTLRRAGGVSPPLAGEPVVKILDMGLARLDEAGDDSLSSLTQEGSVVGTPDFVSPEQSLNSRCVDIRGDLYSLGCTFYYLLAGQVPFPGGSLAEKLLKHQLQAPAPLEQFRPDVPMPVAAIVARLMAKQPEQRFQTPAELVHVLETLHMPVAAIPVLPESPPPSDQALLSLEDWEALAASNPYPLSRPEYGIPARTSEETQTSSSSVVAPRPPTGTEPPKRLVLGVALGALASLLVVAVTLALLLGRSSPSPSSKAPASRGGMVYLADLQESQVLVGFGGFGKKGDLGYDRGRIIFKGIPSPNGISLHPPRDGISRVVYKLGGEHRQFQATAAINDSARNGLGAESPLTFIVSGDGVQLWKSPELQKCGDSAECNVRIAGIDLLKLEVQCAAGALGAHAVWLEPRVR